MIECSKYKLSECCLSISDGDHLPPPKVDAGIPFITISDIDSSNRLNLDVKQFVPEEYYNNLKDIRKAQRNDILYSVVGSFGIPVIIKGNDKFVFQRHIAILRPDPTKVIPDYLFYIMKSYNFYMQADSVAIGAAQRTISLTALRNMTVELPSIDVQRKIATTLSRYDSLIDNYQKQIRLLEEAAQRLYKEWFVNLRFPGHENTKIVDGVPEGWEKKKISDICDTIGGGTPSTKEASYYEGGTIKWVTPTDITKNKGLCLLDTDKKITEEGLKHSSAKMLPAGTILMTSRASVGYFGIADFEVCTNQGFISCIPSSKYYQMYLLRNLMNRIEEIRIKAGGSTYLEISKSVFRNLDIICPSDKILQKFQARANAYYMQEKNLSIQLRLLAESCDRLLPKLLSGEIEV